MNLIIALALALSMSLIPRGACAAQPSIDEVNRAGFQGGGEPGAAAVLKLQILLDRAHASPGEIDGRLGQNTRKAIEDYRQMTGMKAGTTADRDLWDRLAEDTPSVLVLYQIKDADAAGPFVENISDDYREKASLKRLAFTGPVELLAEKFHMSEELLRALNPDASFDRPGTTIVVASVNRRQLPALTKIHVDATEQRVRAFDDDNRMVAAYPATVGSVERPSPTGSFTVTAVARDPVYYYDPSNDLRGVDVGEKLQIPPGPNNPVGSVWIDLSAKGYGIHGTAEPHQVSRAASHGCIRLTNWDAEELAQHVRRGTSVVIGAR